MIYLPGLVLALAVLWFSLSGQTSAIFLALAAVSVLATLGLAGRLRIIGREASPYHRAPQLAAYAGWLMVEIVKANLAVIRLVLDPRHSISPALVNVPTECRSDMAKALFANSITLTPGTVTIDVEPNVFVVHALQEENARTHSFAPMARKAAWAAGAGRGPKRYLGKPDA
jgi:multicomponent Na+:H+ antiporter subunit E